MKLEGGDIMPDIIDNIKVGEYIKKLLKQHNMTQDDLAESLNISKSAVSQNLRGKSSFDIQNLIAISKLFNITLDELLNLKTEESNDVISEYQKVVNQGLGALQKVPPLDLSIADPDLYGKVLVDYIIDQRQLDMLIYLIENKVTLVPEYHHRAKLLYLRIIKYLLEENQFYFYEFIQGYCKLHGSFLIEDKTIECVIWGLFNQDFYQDYMYEFIKNKSSLMMRVLSKLDEKERMPLTRLDYIDIIGRYQLKNLLKTFMKAQPRDDDFSTVIDVFLKHKFYEGITIYLDHFYITPITSFKKTVIDSQNTFLKILDSNQYDLVIEFSKRKLYTDITQIVKKAIMLELEPVYSSLIARHHEEINFKKIGEVCVDQSNHKLLDSIMTFFNQDDLNYLFGYTKVTNTDTLIYLIKHGAKIEEKYYNLDTFKKMNHIISAYLKKGE
jgi:transcriptional regulator with XRE-family HTH domain